MGSFSGRSFHPVSFRKTIVTVFVHNFAMWKKGLRLGVLRPLLFWPEAGDVLRHEVPSQWRAASHLYTLHTPVFSCCSAWSDQLTSEEERSEKPFLCFVFILFHSVRDLLKMKTTYLIFLTGKHKYSVVFGVGGSKFRTENENSETGNPTWMTESNMYVFLRRMHICQTWVPELFWIFQIIEDSWVWKTFCWKNHSESVLFCLQRNTEQRLAISFHCEGQRRDIGTSFSSHQNLALHEIVCQSCQGTTSGIGTFLSNDSEIHDLISVCIGSGLSHFKPKIRWHNSMTTNLLNLAASQEMSVCWRSAVLPSLGVKDWTCFIASSWFSQTGYFGKDQRHNQQVTIAGTKAAKGIKHHCQWGIVSSRKEKFPVDEWSE